jgi:hypothetical protein
MYKWKRINISKELKNKNINLLQSARNAWGREG